MKGTAILVDESSFDLMLVPQPSVKGENKEKIVQGVSIGDATRQNQALMLYMYPGELKEEPMLGVGIADITLDSNILEWQYTIRKQFEEDGQTVDSVSVDNNLNLTIDASYN